MRVIEKVERPKPAPPECSASGCGLVCVQVMPRARPWLRRGSDVLGGPGMHGTPQVLLLLPSCQGTKRWGGQKEETKA